MTVFAAGSTARTPALLVDQHLGVGMSMLDRIPKQEAVITPAWISACEFFRPPPTAKA